MSWMIVLLGFATAGLLPGLAAAAGLPAAAVPESAQLTLILPPEDQVCDFGAEIEPWADASDPAPFATAPTARLDEQELWAATSLGPMLAVRYADGVPHLVVLDVPAVMPTELEFTVRGWRRKWPLC